MRAPEARAKSLLYFAGKPHFDACCDQKMGATVAPISKKLVANPKRWGSLAPWPPLISIADFDFDNIRLGQSIIAPSSDLGRGARIIFLPCVKNGQNLSPLNTSDLCLNTFFVMSFPKLCAQTKFYTSRSVSAVTPSADDSTTSRTPDFSSGKII